MDSLLFAKGPQMGNKMFVQLFNVKNIHFWSTDSVSSLGETEQAVCKGLVRGRQAAVCRDICNPDC